MILCVILILIFLSLLFDGVQQNHKKKLFCLYRNDFDTELQIFRCISPFHLNYKDFILLTFCRFFFTIDVFFCTLCSIASVCLQFEYCYINH